VFRGQAKELFLVAVDLVVVERRLYTLSS
jgi:hypothetical protein